MVGLYFAIKLAAGAVMVALVIAAVMVAVAVGAMLFCLAAVYLVVKFLFGLAVEYLAGRAVRA